MGAVLPLYIVEPRYWALPDTSARQWSFTAEALADLRGQLADIGAPLVVRVGDAVDVLARICRQAGITRMISHEETGNQWTYARDLAVKSWAQNTGLAWEELPQSGVVRRLGGRDGWRARRDGFMADDQCAAPIALNSVANIEPGPIPSARVLKLPDDRCPHRQTGGRAQAVGILDSFLTFRGEPYRLAMSSPVTAERACSRLSAHTALGSMSVREVVQATSARQSARPGGQWAGALASFQSRLAWRDHFMQKLEDQPSIETRCLQPAAESLRPRDSDASRLAAWSNGETGLPFLDACMRYLAATGWLNFRMRSMVMACASYHLWLDWRDTGAVLARRFTDYEPGIHWPQVQMQSGTTGMNTPRIYNPVKQGWDHDPTGVFTRRWLPELAAVPDEHLQEPWKWAGAGSVLGHRYPDPLVDVASAARAARDAVWGLRRKPAARAELAVIIEQHASRAPRRARARPRTPATDQLSLDI